MEQPCSDPSLDPPRHISPPGGVALAYIVVLWFAVDNSYRGGVSERCGLLDGRRARAGVRSTARAGRRVRHEEGDQKRGPDEAGPLFSRQRWEER